jgi:LacI family transcriptional regulator
MTMTLEDIAKISGVSRSTVSRVINGDPNVSSPTRDRVLGIINQYNFQPNLAARGLAAGRTQVLGLVIPQGVGAIFTEPFFPLLIQGVSSTCNAHDYSVMLWLAEPEYERRTLGQILYSGLIDGVIVSSMLLNDPILESLSEGEMPFVTIGRHPTNTRVNYVDVDNRNSAHEAVSYLYRTGRKRIGIVTGSQNSIAGLDRLDGYLDALREFNIARDPKLIIESDFSESGGYYATQRLISQKPDAIFAASDNLAIGVLRALHYAGIKVPDDVAVIGFDDIPIASRTNPPLTTVRQPIPQLGSTAADTLIDIIERPAEHPRRIVLPAELVIRSTT